MYRFFTRNFKRKQINNKKTSMKEADYLKVVREETSSTFLLDMDENSCDFKVEASDGVRISAHKWVLKQKSGLFRELFTSAEGRSQSYILIAKYDSEVMTVVLTYLYTNIVGIKDTNVERIISAADYFKIDSLKLKCGNYIKDNVDIKTSFKYRGLADKYQLSLILVEIEIYIRENFLASVSSSQEFLDLDHDGVLKVSFFYNH